MEELQDNGRIRYTYGGVVFIYDPRTKREITSYPSSDNIVGATTGTRFSEPVILEKFQWDDEWYRRFEEQHHLMMKRHAECDHAASKSDQTNERFQKSRAQYKSHSVLVVDMSGSMRRDDVNGARCRSDGVWLSLARDYVKIPLERGERSGEDLISIVVMRDTAEVVMKYEPTTWILYNKLIDMREWKNIRPGGHGNYIPAIEAAEELLTCNAHAGCSLSLLFFSDGRPSDKSGDFAGKIGALASKFGRRLSITCIGMADIDEDFSALNDMVTEAQSYGSQASFGKPSLDTDSLSNIISSLATSLTASKTEMTDIKSRTGSSKLVRMDVTREKHDTPDYVGSWRTYKNSDPAQFVRRIWTWRHKRGLDFVEVFDPRCTKCYKEVGMSTNIMGIVCHVCESFCLCHNCNAGPRVLQEHYARYGHRGSKCDALLAKKRMGKLIRKELPSFSIAVKDNIFGEGAERIVRKVRFIDELGQYIGPHMVAKESRFVENDDSYEERMEYHRSFLRTQDIANDFGKQFNAALDNLAEHFDARHHRWVKNLPRIEFIEPMVVEVMDKGQERNILVEKMLEGEYKKFNNNMGYVDKEARDDRASPEVDDLVGQLNDMGLGAIEEEDSKEEDSDSDNDGDDDEEGEVEDNNGNDGDDLFDTNDSAPISGTYRDVKDAYFPQAFSHFSYERSRKHFIVVDLQGVFTVRADGTRCYELTDPVIHKHSKKSRQKYKALTFGRTDRGEKGMRAFFKSHVCTDVCKLLGLTEVNI